MLQCLNPSTVSVSGRFAPPPRIFFEYDKTGRILVHLAVKSLVLGLVVFGGGATQNFLFRMSVLCKSHRWTAGGNSGKWGSQSPKS